MYVQAGTQTRQIKLLDVVVLAFNLGIQEVEADGRL